MDIKRFLLKPEYYYRPTQIVRRLKLSSEPPIKSVDLLWGHRNFFLNPEETIGRSIATQGLYDLALTECIFRLIAKDSVCVDVGANIGYFTSLMSFYGKEVHAFEPHPDIFEKLTQNSKILQNVQLYPLALSDVEGEASLYIPHSFKSNEGISSLQPKEGSKEIRVKTKKLDELFPSQTIDILKMDVEGHELSVLRGSKNLLAESRIKFIVFEDFEGLHSEVIKELQGLGYNVYRLSKGFFKLRLLSVSEGESEPTWNPPNYLATKLKLPKSMRGTWKVLKF